MIDSVNNTTPITTAGLVIGAGVGALNKHYLTRGEDDKFVATSKLVDKIAENINKQQAKDLMERFETLKKISQTGSLEGVSQKIQKEFFDWGGKAPAEYTAEELKTIAASKTPSEEWINSTLKNLNNEFKNNVASLERLNKIEIPDNITADELKKILMKNEDLLPILSRPTGEKTWEQAVTEFLAEDFNVAKSKVQAILKKEKVVLPTNIQDARISAKNLLENNFDFEKKSLKPLGEAVTDELKATYGILKKSMSGIQYKAVGIRAGIGAAVLGAIAFVTSKLAGKSEEKAEAKEDKTSKETEEV